MALEKIISKSTEELNSVLGGDYPLDSFLSDWDMTFEELLDDDSIGYPQEESLMKLRGIEGTHQSKQETPDYQQQFAATEEDVAEMSLAELISQGSDVAGNFIVAKLEEMGIPPEAALLMAGVLGKSPKKMAKGAKGMLKGDKGSKNQVNPDKKFDSDKGTKHKINPDKPTGAKEVKPTMTTGRKAELVSAGGLTTALGLMGDRDKDGNLKVATPEPDYDVFDEEALDPPTGPDMPEEVKEERPGWHKREGQNFWTVNNDSPYWDTEEGKAEAVEVWG